MSEMKSKYIYGILIIVVFLGFAAYKITDSNIAYEEDFAKIKQSENTFRATGQWVKAKDYQLDKQTRTFTFHMVDAFGTEMKVVYNGTIPNNFESATSVVVTGKYQQGHFQAKDILTKCPSKYENEYQAEQKNKSASL